MMGRASWAAGGISKLAKGADSESVRLRALRALLGDMITVSKYTGLEERMASVEERLRQQSGSNTP